ncbi:MAG: NADAR family protein [Bacteroidota bacterium]
MKYHKDWLIGQIQLAPALKYLFFWGHRPSRDGSITHTCLSQWWAGHPFEVEGIPYPTAEHWMMAGKARLFQDTEVLNKILACSSAPEAKKLGRQVRQFSPETWNQHRSMIVEEGNYHKFSQHPALREYLLNTSQRILVEASPYDSIWGIGMGKENPHASHPHIWKGLNLLGFALMEVRDRLREDISQ